METASRLAPPVVAVIVVHEPGPWFDRAVDGLAAQDYANLKVLVLVTGDPGGVADRVQARLPDAFVRDIGANPGFGPAANEVLDLVEGDNGFFCFLHDDVALERSCIRLLVEELYRSNAGLVGPKLMDWDAPRVLQHVGLGVDRFGEIDELVEPGELDQEQHDAIRDVFALSSACLLIRADLFRSLGGFDPAIAFHGEALDLCWRAHRSGARVMVVPAAVGRHRGRLEERLPDAGHALLAERNRMRTVVTLTSARRLPLLLVELGLLSVGQFVVALASGSGRARERWAAVRAYAGLVLRVPELVRRRRAVGAGRRIPDREVAGLQMRGSARLTSYRRARGSRAPTLGGRVPLRQRTGGTSTIAWFTVLAIAVVGSRHLLTDGVPAIGQFLPFDDSPSRMLDQYTSGWWSRGLGSTTAMPTGIALIGLGGIVTLFNMGLLHTLGVIGLLVAGYLGVWRLAGCMPSQRARLTLLVVYAAVPLPGELISVGRWSALTCYAAVPWAADLLRRAAGIVGGDDEGDVTVAPSSRDHTRLVAQLGLLAALTTAFVPSFGIVLVLLAVVLALAALGLGAGRQQIPAVIGTALAAAAVGAFLNLPWLATLVGRGGWSTVVGAPSPTRGATSLVDLATFGLGTGGGLTVCVTLYASVVVAPLVARGWRFTWALRGASAVVCFGWLAILNERGALPVRLPEAGILLAPVALGVAVAASCLVAAFEADVRGGHFGWRQPIAVLAGLGIVVGIVPGVLATSSGRWNTPRSSMIDLLVQLPGAQASGDYRVLWVGDQQVVPVAGLPYRDGITYAVTSNRRLAVDDVWAARPTEADRAIAAALDAIATGATARAGRLLAPLSIRFVVVPLVDGVASTDEAPLPAPAGLHDALADQLDLGETTTLPNLIVFENKAWIPLRSVLSAAGAAASSRAGLTELAGADTSGATPIMVGADALAPALAEVPAGTVHLAIPFDERWTLSVDGTQIEPRPAFGTTMAFDVPAAGVATGRYDSDVLRTIMVVAQIAAWLLVVLLAAGLSLGRPARARLGAAASGPAGPILNLDDAGSGAAPRGLDAAAPGELTDWFGDAAPAPAGTEQT